MLKCCNRDTNRHSLAPKYRYAGQQRDSPPVSVASHSPITTLSTENLNKTYERISNRMRVRFHLYAWGFQCSTWELGFLCVCECWFRIMSPRAPHTLVLCGYLKEGVAVHCSVAWSVAFIRRSVPETITPLFDHVEAFGMPNVCLQPNVLPLAAVELQKQVSVAPTSLTAFTFWWFFLLWAGLEGLLPLEEENNNRQWASVSYS